MLAVVAPRALAADWRRRLRDPLGLGVALFVVSALVSTATSRAVWISILGANESYFGLLTILAYAVLFLATRELCASPDDARRLLLAPVLAAAVVGAYTVVQIAGLDPILYGRVSRFGGFVRPFATMGNPNHMSAFLAAALPLVLVALDRARRQGQCVVAGALALVAVLAGVAIVVAVSRGAWLAALAALLVGLALGGVGRRAAAAAVAVAGGIAAALALLALAAPAGVVVLGSVAHRVRAFAEGAGRAHIWRAAWALFRDHPLVGTGLDTFQIAFADKRTTAYWETEWNSSPTRAHNEALNLLATQGALGGLAVLALAAGALLAIRRALRATDDRGLVVALAAGLAAFAVQDLFNFTVAGCGTLAVTGLALLSRAAGPPADAAGRDGGASLALALAAVVALGGVILALNVEAAPLLDEPARVLGGALVAAALLGGALVTWALEQPGRPPVFTAAARRAPPAPGASALALAARWLLGAALLVLLVLRPLAAARAAYQGMLLTPTAPTTAAARLEEAVRLDPYMELYWVKLGSAAHAQARVARDAADRGRALEATRVAYERAIELVPANSYNYANLGRVTADLAHEGRATPAEAYAAFDRALALDPNNAYFYADAAGGALVAGDLERARDYASRGLALYPRFALLRAQLGHLAMVRQRPAEAAPLLQAALDADWHGADRARAGASANLAAAWLQLGKPAAAEAPARLAVELMPTVVEARFNLAKALEGQGRRAEAVEEYRRLLAQQPDYEPARVALRALGG